MVLNMNEKEMIEIQKLLSRLKKGLKVEYNNDKYQEWAKGDKKVKFQEYVIDNLKDYIYRNFQDKQFK